MQQLLPSFRRALLYPANLQAFYRPGIMATFASSFHINPASGLSQATQSTPCLWLGPAFSVLTTLINLLAKAESNKYLLFRHTVLSTDRDDYYDRNGMRQLEERCLGLLSIIQSEAETMVPDDKSRLCSGAQRLVARRCCCMKGS